MAKKIVEVYTDDMTGESVPEGLVRTTSILHEGWFYRLDLGPDSYTAYVQAIQPFLDKAERSFRAGPAVRTPASTATAQVDKGQRDTQRRWWTTNWNRTEPQLPMPRSRGRLPARVTEAYEEAGGQNLPETAKKGGRPRKATNG